MIKILILALLLLAGLVPASSAAESRMMGPDGREIILYSAGSWKFAAPLDFKLTTQEHSVQILDVRVVSGNRTSRNIVPAPGGLPPVADQTKSQKAANDLQVTYLPELTRARTEYDPPEEYEAEVFDPVTGQTLSKVPSARWLYHLPDGFVWPENRPANTVTFTRDDAWPKKIGLRVFCRKQFTLPPANLITFEFKEIPVFQ